MAALKKESQYQYIDIADNYLPDSITTEQMGSKEKFWFVYPDTQEVWLVKFARNNTGENWSEKLAAEVAQLLGVPHALVELGVLDGRPLSLTKNFLGAGETLIHGNELLSRVDSTYPTRDRNYGVREHTLRAVHDALVENKIQLATVAPPVLKNAFAMFVGYLLLDALIGNTDRHHENWAIVASGSGPSRILELAPSYDHASSLGREHLDSKRIHILNTTDKQRDISSYCRKARSAFYPDGGTGKPLSCMMAFEYACRFDSGATTYWSNRIAHISTNSFRQLIRQVPEQCMSQAAREFTLAVLQENHKILLEKLS